VGGSYAQEVDISLRPLARSDIPAWADLMASVGMRGEPWTFQMRTPLEAIPPARPLPAGYRLRGYDASMSDALRQAHNAAFLDHPKFTPWSEVTGPGEDRRRRGGQDREGDPARNGPFPPHDHHVWPAVRQRVAQLSPKSLLARGAA
jgi:hypothetical protein